MLRDSSWKISFSGSHYQDLSLPCSMKFDERVPLHSSMTGAWEVWGGVRWGGGIKGKCIAPPHLCPSIRGKKVFFFFKLINKLAEELISVRGNNNRHPLLFITVLPQQMLLSNEVSQHFFMFKVMTFSA